MPKSADPVILGDSTPDRQRTQPLQREEQQPQQQQQAPTAAAPADASHQQQRGKSRRKRGRLAAVGRSVTKGPRMLGRRIKHFLRDEMYVDVSFQKMPATGATEELATMELLAVYHRWLRGVQALLSIIVFLLSLMSIPGSAVYVNVTIFIISQLCCLIICKTYHVKAQFCGITNVLFEGRNIFTSPFVFHMIVEVVLWNIQTPPIVVFWGTFLNLLNYFIFLRLYGIILYLNNAAYVYRTFCRAMEAVSDLPLSTSFLIRTALVFHPYRVCTAFGLTSWLSIGCMYAKAEGVSIGTGIWFSAQTLTTLGYGDVTPVTVAGRAVVIIAGLCSFLFVAYIIVYAQGMLTSTDAEWNMQVLARCHDLTHTLRSRSAWVIQTAWKLRRARTAAGPNPGKKQQLKILLLSGLLTHTIAALRRTRQGLRAAQRDFRETDVNPLTGLSAYQFSTYVYETHLAARRLQRVKDVDRVHLALKDRDVPASSLTREDIETIIMADGPRRLDDGGAMTPPLLSPRGGSFVSLSSMYAHAPFTPGTPGASVAGGAAGGATQVNVQAWQERVEKLESKCAQLAMLLDIVAAAAETHPPSMAVSQV